MITSVAMPEELLEHLDEVVENDPKLENRSHAVRYAIRETYGTA